MSKAKTMVTGPQPIRCSGCTAVTEQTVDRARGDGWGVGWRPDHPSWCPECLGANKRRQQVAEPYDEPMF